MIDRPSTDLPEPDSPTTATVSRRKMARSTPSTAFTVRPGVVSQARSPSTDKIGASVIARPATAGRARHRR